MKKSNNKVRKSKVTKRLKTKKANKINTKASKKITPKSKACKTKKQKKPSKNIKKNKNRKTLKKQSGGAVRRFSFNNGTEELLVEYEYNDGEHENGILNLARVLIKYLKPLDLKGKQSAFLGILNALYRNNFIEKDILSIKTEIQDEIQDRISALDDTQLPPTYKPASSNSAPPTPTFLPVQRGNIVYVTKTNEPSSSTHLPVSSSTPQYSILAPKNERFIPFLRDLLKPESHNYQALIIDLDTVLKPEEGATSGLSLIELFKKCSYNSSNPSSFKATCESVGQKVRNVENYFYDYDYLVRLLSSLHQLMETTGTIRHVFFASDKYSAREIIPAFIGIPDLERDILIPLLRGNDISRIIGGRISRMNPVSRKGDYDYNFLEPYFMCPFENGFNSQKILDFITAKNLIIGKTNMPVQRYDNDNNNNNGSSNREFFNPRTRAPTLWQNTVYFLTANSIIINRSFKRWKLEVTNLSILSVETRIIQDGLALLSASSESPVLEENPYGTIVRGVEVPGQEGLDTLHDIVDSPPPIIVIDAATFIVRPILASKPLVDKVANFLKVILCSENPSNVIIASNIIDRAVLKKYIIGDYNTEIATKLIRGSGDLDYLVEREGKQRVVSDPPGGQIKTEPRLPFFDKYLIAPDSDPSKGLQGDLSDPDVFKEAIKAWLTMKNPGKEVKLVFITTHGNIMTREVGSFDIVRVNFEDSEPFELPESCEGGATPPPKRVNPAPPTPVLTVSPTSTEKSSDLYREFIKHYPTESALEQKKFDMIKPKNAPEKIHLVEAFDIYLFDFDKTITRGCVDTRHYPIIENGRLVMQPLTMDYLNFIRKSGEEAISKFVADLFGLENGYFFVKFIRYLVEEGKKIAIVTLGPSDVIYECLDILFEFSKGRGISKSVFKNPFHNPYTATKDYPRYAEVMSGMNNDGQISKETALSMIDSIDDSSAMGNGFIYKSGVILSTHPNGKLDLSGNKLEPGEYFSELVSRGKQHSSVYRKNKMVLRLVENLSGMTEIRDVSQAEKQTWFLRTIYFDDDPQNIDLLMNPSPSSIYLSSISGIKLGQIKLTESDELNQSFLNSTRKTYTVQGAECSYNGFGLSLETILKLEADLQKKILKLHSSSLKELAKPTSQVLPSDNCLPLSLLGRKVDQKSIPLTVNNKIFTAKDRTLDFSTLTMEPKKSLSPIIPPSVLFNTPK